ncbi:MAG TPA: fatty acid desaturase [Roseiarcus sp.]|jgi:fatty acid desaturase
MDVVDLPRVKRGLEWPTLGLVAVIYGLWFATTYFHRYIPLWALAPIGAWTVAWQMSLQHEIIHGHPTRQRWINTWIGQWPLVVWLPFETYRHSHLQHHNDTRLTDPLDDPESYYWTDEQWRALGRVGTFVVRLQSSLIGRVTIGPGWAIGRFWFREAKTIAAGNNRELAIIARHLLEAAVVCLWVFGVCRMPFWTYALCFVYAGTGLALVRSFAEHRSEAAVEERTAIVEDSWIFGTLFLFNNLHAAHHMRGSMPWYELPRWYRLNRDALIERNGGLVYHTYFDVARRYLFRPHDGTLLPQPGHRAP